MMSLFRPYVAGIIVVTILLVAIKYIWIEKLINGLRMKTVMNQSHTSPIYTRNNIAAMDKREWQPLATMMVKPARFTDYPQSKKENALLTSKANLKNKSNNGTLNTERIFCIHNDGPIESKLRLYNSFIEKLRGKVLSAASGKGSNPFTYKKILSATRSNFINGLMALPTVTTVVLPWNNESESNLPIVNYYKWMGDHEVNSVIKRMFGPPGAYWISSHAPLNQTTSAGPFSEAALSLRPWDFKIPKSTTMRDNTCTEYNTFISLMENARVTPLGVVLATGHVIRPFARFDIEYHPKNQTKIKTFGEVFVITQRFPDHYYHNNVDMVPRLAPYLPLLKRNKRIYIHIGPTTTYPDLFFEIIGLPRTRFIRGLVEAELLYFPEPSYIHSPIPLGIQLISAHYTQAMTKMFGEQTPDTVVLMKRTRKRIMANNDHLRDVIMNMTQLYGLRFMEFSDKPFWSYVETLKLFRRAVMVIGGHGAGFTNLLYCQPGVFVIEIFCEPPETFLSIPHLAYHLGHHYYGLVSAGQECPRSVTAPLTKLLNLLENIMPIVVEEFRPKV